MIVNHGLMAKCNHYVVKHTFTVIISFENKIPQISMWSCCENTEKADWRCVFLMQNDR